MDKDGIVGDRKSFKVWKLNSCNILPGNPTWVAG
jgi:hypothetical protein